MHEETPLEELCRPFLPNNNFHAISLNHGFILTMLHATFLQNLRWNLIQGRT